MMVKEDNFGYSLASDENTVASLRETARRSRRYAFISLLETAVIPYVGEKCYEIFPEPWNNTAYSGMILLEIIAVGACLNSLYQWRKNSKLASELEQLVGAEK